MTEEILPDIYRLEIPLPRNPLKAVNSYVIRGADRFLIVDTGMNRPKCLHAMRASLEALGVDLGRSDFFVTHSHADHIGLVSELKAQASRIFLHPAEAAVVRDPHLWTGMAEMARAHGFPDPDTAVMKHPGRRYLFSGEPDFTPAREGDVLSIGRYAFRCVGTPGHTPGHLCLYEPAARIFLSGDHILDTITPNIAGWRCGPDPLGEFLESLDKIKAYDIRLILPGHRNAMRDHPRRIEELKAHHRARMQEVLDILSGGPQTAYQVASQMTWNIDCPQWSDFPIPQQWFATGEALSHLLHLERLRQITPTCRDGRILFGL